MLQKLNERIQGLVAWIIISLVAITFLLFGLDYYIQAHHESNSEVMVNGQAISQQSIDSNYRRTRQSRDLSELTSSSEKELKQQLLNEMIVNSVSVQSARANGFEVSLNQADSAILGIPQFQEDGHFSTDRYTQALNNGFFTPESFQQEVRQGMLLNQQRYALIGTSFALPGDLEQFVKLYMQTRDYEYARIPVRLFINKSSVNQQSIVDYYQAHTNEFIEPEKVSVDFIRVSLENIKKSIHISDEQINQYYEDNKLSIAKPLESIKAAIKQQLIAEQAQIQFSRQLEKLSDLSYQTPDSLTSVAEVLNLPIETSEYFSHNGGNTNLSKNKQIIKAAFSRDVLELGNNSDPIQLNNETVLVLRVHHHVLASTKSLGNVRGLIIDQLARINAEHEAQQLGMTIVNDSLSREKQAKLVHQNKLKWSLIKKAARDSDNAPPSVNDLAFSLAKPGSKTGQLDDEGNYIVVILKSINNGRLASVDQEQARSITQQIEANYGVMDYDIYVAGLMSKAKIVKG